MFTLVKQIRHIDQQKTVSSALYIAALLTMENKPVLAHEISPKMFAKISSKFHECFLLRMMLADAKLTVTMIGFLRCSELHVE